MPFLNFKKILIWLGLIILVIAAAWWLYAVLVPKLADETPGLTGPGAAGTSDGLPQAGQNAGRPAVSETPPGQLAGQPSQTPEIPATTAPTRANKIQDLIEFTSFAPTLAADGASVQYYDQADNKFYKINGDGTINDLSAKEFYQVENVIWSPQKNKAILEYPDGNKIIYDFSTDKQVTLPQHWQEFNFSPNGEEVVFKSMGLDPDNRWLAIMASDGSEARSIEKIGNNAEKVIVSWSPNNQIIGMMTEGSNFDQKKIYFIGRNNENFRSLTVEGRGFLPNWSPQGDKLLYSVYSSANDLKPMLWITNAQGDDTGTDTRPLNLETWANKCVFAAAEEVYCAVPKVMPAQAGLIPALARNINDDLYLINITSGQKTLVDDADQYSMSNLVLADNGNSLYFTDQKSGRMYKLAL